MTGLDFDAIATSISPDQFARAIGATKTSDGYRCPRGNAHNNGDRKGSFSISRKDNRTVACCHVCGLNGSPVQVAAEVWGVPLPDAAQRLARDIGLAVATAGSNGRGELIEAYEYTDEAGGHLFEVVRFAFPRTFRQRVRHGKGWTWRLGDVRRVLYKLPQVRTAVAEGRFVFVPEGEKDVGRLESLGLVATTCPGGAGKWRDEYSESLRGGRVLVLPDNDKVGKAHALDVAARLHGIAKDVRIVELPGLEEKGDVSDWLDKGGTVQELKNLVSGTHLWTPEASSTRTDEPQEMSEGVQLPEEEELTGLPQAIPALDAADDEVPSFVIDEFAFANEIHLLVSDGGVGKTTLALGIAGAFASAFAALDRFPTLAPGPVLIVSEEDTEGFLRDRLEALCVGHGWSVTEVLSRVHLLCLAGAQIDQAHWQQHILTEVERVGAVAVFLDPWFDLLSGNENSNTDVRPAIKFLRRLATTATVFVCAHAGKAVEGKRKIDRVRGASALYSAARVVYFLELDDRGMAVQPLKFSRGEIPKRFVVGRTVETDPENRAVWRSARLTYLTPGVAQELGAEKLVSEALEKKPGSNTTELKECAKGTGVSAVEVSQAIKSLENRGVITFKPGPNNSKQWTLCPVAEESRPARQATLPGCPELAGQARNAPQDLAHPFRGQAGASGNQNLGKQLGSDPTEVLAEAVE